MQTENVDMVNEAASPKAKPRQSAEIDLTEARKAFFLMVGFIGLIWLLQLINVADNYHLDQEYGILPRSVTHLPDIFSAPFLHFSWDHIEGNSGPLFIFGLLAAYRGVVKFLGVTLVVIITSGMAVWFFQGSNELTVGASGVIFGYFGYVLSRGVFDRNLFDSLVAVVMGLSYYYLLTIAIPGAPGGVSWIGHLGGLIGGLACGWIFRTRRGLRYKQQKPAGPAKTTSTAVIPVSADNPRADLYKELGEMGL
jgi:membrane associated rhomboid family serine protease